MWVDAVNVNVFLLLKKKLTKGNVKDRSIVHMSMVNPNLPDLPNPNVKKFGYKDAKKFLEPNTLLFSNFWCMYYIMHGNV